MILFGFKGVGKTTLGKLLAQKLDLPFFDTDALLLKKESGTISDVYRRLGEKHFRLLEKEIILHLPKTRCIIAVGGGAILDPDNVKQLYMHGPLIYLSAPFSLIKKRLTESPAFTDNLKACYEQRKPLYEKIPALRLEITNLSPEELLAQLIRLADVHLPD